MFRRTIPTLMVILVGSSTAVAQTSTNPHPSGQQVSPPPAAVIAQQSLTQALAEREYAQRVSYVQRDQAVRWERAQRLTAMANQGQCDQAIAIARRESDVDMAERLSAACDSQR